MKKLKQQLGQQTTNFMKTAIKRLFQYISYFFFQVAIRMYEIFPKKYGPFGLGMFGFAITFNLLCSFHYLINSGMISKDSEGATFIISISLGGLIGILTISFFTGENNYNRVLKKEILLCNRHNMTWRLITWLYLLVTIVTTYFVLY